MASNEYDIDYRYHLSQFYARTLLLVNTIFEKNLWCVDFVKNRINFVSY